MAIPYKWILAGPPGLFLLGFLMNSLVIAANHGQMPVLMPGSCDPLYFAGDPIHTCMTHATHLKFLADWVWVGSLGAIASPGDFLIWAYQYLSVPSLWLWTGLAVKERGWM